jgi:hypothetical protein
MTASTTTDQALKLCFLRLPNNYRTGTIFLSGWQTPPNTTILRHAVTPFSSMTAESCFCVPSKIQESGFVIG